MDKKEKAGMSFWLQLQKENRIKKLEKYRCILEITGALSFLVILLNISPIIIAGVSPSFSPKTTLIAVIFSVLIGICMILYVFVVYNIGDLKSRKRII